MKVRDPRHLPPIELHIVVQQYHKTPKKRVQRSRHFTGPCPF